MQLYLIRHPRPAIAPGICYGASDLPLAADPAPLAARLRPQLPAAAPVFSSPLRRCVRLAEALHATPQIDARLGEINFGDWELKPWDNIDRGALDAWAADPIGFSPPGGEAPRDVLERALDWLAGLLDGGLPAAVAVTHAGVMRVLAGYGRGLPEAAWIDLRFDCGSVASFTVDTAAGGRVAFLGA